MGIAAVPQGVAHTERLESLWSTPKTWLAELATVDHKKLGRRYLVTSFVFFVLGGIEAALLRIQLAQPEAHVLSAEAYNQLFTMHGTTMMFLFIQPVLSAFSFFLIPLMIGARELAFPRLNAFGYWGFVLAGAFIYASFLVGQAPNGGWFAYTPFTLASYDPGLNIDFYAIGLILLGVSTTAGAINIIVTVFKMRAPGMSIDRMPLFLWSSMTTSWAVVFAMPALTAALVFLELERRWNFVFYTPRFGGTPILWQHLFWIFGHPWVYIVFLPATGMLSMVIPTFSRRPIVGHTWVVLATVVTGLVGFGVWVHHMFAIGMPQLSMSFFGAASMVITIPSAVQIFAWIGTMWNGRVVFTTSMLFALGFIVQFLIGGISGVMTAIVPFDWQVHDTYFVVGHIHYVLAGSSLFAVLAGLFYWFPKMTGRLLGERLGRWSFWVSFIGFNVGFFPMHIAGLLGMPRRIYTYDLGLGLGPVNLVETIGTGIFTIGLFLILWNVVQSLRRGELAGADPWGANTLEWAAASPPEHFNFANIPEVSSRNPLWDGGWTPGPAYDELRLTPRTSALDAELESVEEMPEDNSWPLVLALAGLVVSIGLLVRWYWVAGIAMVVVLWSMARWLWPVHVKVARTDT